MDFKEENKCHICGGYKHAIGYHNSAGEFVKLATANIEYISAGLGINYYNRGVLTVSQCKAWVKALRRRNLGNHYTYIRLRKYVNSEVSQTSRKALICQHCVANVENQ